jgi:uncharacterized protein (TIGR02147 family)
MTSLSDIRDFDSYREYLRAFIEAEKASQSKLTSKKIADRLGFSESHLRMILSGQRDLTVHNIHLLIRKMKLSYGHGEIFEALILRDQAEGIVERKYYQKRLQKLTSRNLKYLRTSDETLLQEWYLPALLGYLQMAKAGKLRLSEKTLAEWLSQRFKAPIGNIQRAIEWIEQRPEFLDQTQRPVHLMIDRINSGFGAEKYVRSVFSQLLERLTKDFKTAQSLYSVKTISLDQDEITQLATDYNSLMEEYMQKESENSNNNTVVQICFGLFRP